ncbi:PREDICTED: uncharacterized protein LOC104601764 isoform X1 [Nelumbo nucifera]|uniref:Uncharacterized protein LOC104601764 isoform X1 n=2 Tax=Nelumbo nucifera TaxID=4432 RepID=A0A1U8ADF5_NELNU|nr:PREDICTED: uncharacterized protein LOC104601764 isoform X1 [Nelumbo nucifera]DAD21539.1 TPA_asm: hypothetical protein HUJ06_023002 [Nelumbo nucifera]
MLYVCKIMACSENFCSNYLVLSPKNASLVDIFRLLFSSNLENRRFVDCPKDTEETEFRRRQIIFISVIAQKVLLFMAKPMSWVGSVFERWLNLLSSNRNLAVLLLNLVRGNVVVPDETSATFTSTIGNLDKRVELDSSITHENNRYYAALSIMAAKLAYENEAFIQSIITHHWKMKFIGFYNFWNDYQESFSTQGFMFHVEQPELIVVSFRGTRPFDADAWRSDVDISWYEIPEVGRVHGGFMKALGLQKGSGWPKDIIQPAATAAEGKQNQHPFAYYAIRGKLRDMLRDREGAKFILTGHSLGGALAILFAVVLALHQDEWMLKRLDGVYTFGQPRVGDEKLGKFMESQLRSYGVRYLRFVYCNDMVPRLPYDDSTLMFKHFGTCVYYNSCYQGKILQEEPNKNYFSVLMVMPKILNAFWELIRSFTIRFKSGADYKEGSLLRLFRMMGLIVPGVSAHTPQDYVNATRLGSSRLYDQLQGLKLE